MSKDKKEKLLQFIIEYNQKYNRLPKKKDLDSNVSFPPYYQYKKYFGNMNNAYILAGFKPLMKVFTESEIKEITDLYLNSTEKVKDIGNKYGVDEGRIISLMKRMGISGRNKKWSKRQIEILRDIYPTQSWDFILEKLSPFTKDDILHKASSLKIEKSNFGFNEKQVKFLVDNYSNYTIKELANLLGKTESSVAAKAGRLGLLKKEKWSNEEIVIMRKYYENSSSAKMCELLPKRHSNSIIDMSSKLGLYKKYNVYEDEVIKNELLRDLISFAKHLGKTPTLPEIRNNENLRGASTYIRYFGSYSQACKEAGLPVNSMMFGKAYHISSKNGDFCLSLAEKNITDILIDNGIKYDKEILYKDIIKNYKENAIKSDWVINNVIVEYFGMCDRADYRKRMMKKINLCKEYNYPLIDLYPSDLKNNYEGLIKKFAEKGIEIKV
ncbi:hypothetical protein P4571_07700 [Niallia alba]|uniref:homing endonuclease associated repeat-containing protein n=1 Tax=Niallia alba TaxID=2729105 RepID=UPI002E21CF35|nr:hypothetical protein [Niallia alba]